MSKQKITAIMSPVDVNKIKKETSLVVSKAEAFQVKKVEDENKGYDILRQIKERLKTIETMRTAITKPLNTSLKAANSFFRTLKTPLVLSDAIIQDKIMDFREKREEAAERKREALATKKVEEEGMTKKEAEEEAELEVAPRVGNSFTAKRWTFEVIDLGKVPSNYLMLDKVEVNDSIRQGIRKIPGLEIFQEEGLRVR